MRRALVIALACCVVAGAVWAQQSSLLLLAGKVKYLFLDRFTTDKAAPLGATRACEPGPGTWTVTDTEDKISISGGRLTFSGGKAAPAYGDPMVRGGSVGNAGGTAIFGTVTSNSGAATFGYGAGTANPGFRFSNATNVAADTGSSANLEAITLPQELAAIIRPGGVGGWAVRRSPGGTWNLQWVTVTGPNTNPLVASYNSAIVVDNVRATVLPAWANEANIYTSYVASPANPQAATMTADGLVYVTWTPAAGETLELDVRRTDADNRWIHRCDQAGGTIKIIERNAGAETERASGAQTWTAGTAYRIGIVAVGQSIRQLVGTTTRNTYTSAAFNVEATGVGLAGHATATNLYCWPRYVTIPGGV